MPLHARIRSDIEARVAAGTWPRQMQLPSEPDLAAEFKVSRTTVRQALKELVEGGVLYRRRGVGTFVAPVYMQRDLATLSSFSEDAVTRGIRPHSRVLSAGVTGADDDVAKTLDVAPGAAVTTVERLRLHGDTPIALQRVWLPADLCVDLADGDTASGSIYDHLESAHHFRLGWGVQTIAARMPTASERRLMCLPRELALLAVERTTFLDDGRPIELSRATYRSDEQSFSVTLHR